MREARLTYNQEHEVIPDEQETQPAAITNTELHDWPEHIHSELSHFATK